MFTFASKTKRTAVAEPIDTDALRAAMEQLVDAGGERLLLRSAINRDAERLERIPGLIIDLDSARFSYMVKRELDRTLPDRESDFGDQRSKLLGEQETLTGKVDAARTQLGALDRSCVRLQDEIAALRRDVWQAVYDRLAAEFDLEFKAKFFRCWVAADAITNGIHGDLVLARLTGFEQLTTETKLRILDELKSEFNVPARRFAAK